MKYQFDKYIDCLPPELRLIVLCLRSSAGRNAGETPISVTAGDWMLFSELVERHRVISPVYRSLAKLNSKDLPETILTDLLERYQRNTVGVLAKTAELVRIVKLFESRGIPVLPLKGPVLAMQAFGDIGSRHVGDLDILVPPESVLDAEQILSESGYRRVYPAFELTPSQARSYVRTRHHFGYVNLNNGVNVELHWRFGANRRLFPFTFKDLWGERQFLRLGGHDMSVLSLKHTILLLCVHGSIHAWFRLFWLNDIGWLVSGDKTIDWNRIMLEANSAGIGRMVNEGVFLAHTLLGSPMPEPVQAYIRQDKGVFRLAKKSFYLIRYPNAAHPKPFTAAYFLTKKHKDGLRGDPAYKLENSINMLTGATDDWHRVPLPDALFPIYFLFRPFLWFLRWFIPKSRVYRDRLAKQG